MLQPKLIKVEPLDSLMLRLYYETGEIKLFDVTLCNGLVVWAAE